MDFGGGYFGCVTGPSSVCIGAVGGGNSHIVGRRNAVCGMADMVACCGVHFGGGCFGGVSDPDSVCMGVVGGESFQGGGCSRKAKS